MRPRCKKHGSPMFEAADPFGNKTWFFCRACEYARRADLAGQRAQAAQDRGDSQGFMRAADSQRNALEDEKKMSGRWFECKVDGEGWDLSERQIELAKAQGKIVEVITEIV